MTASLLLAGSSGFVGSRILAALHRLGSSDVLLASRRSRTVPVDPRWRSVDIRDSEQVLQACAGKTGIIHAASYIGHDPELQRAVNVDGTRNLVNAAKKTGVERFLYVSNAAVYGDFETSGRDENFYEPRPQSLLSSSRREAEELVLAAGGIVVRPVYVYGNGDRWWLGVITKAVVHLSAWIDRGDARVSVISNNALGAAVAALVDRDDFAHLPRIFHAAYSSPVTVRDMVGTLLDILGMDKPTASISYSDALSELRAWGLSGSQIRGTGQDKFVDSRRLWSFVPEPLPDPLQGMSSWYRSAMNLPKIY